MDLVEYIGEPALLEQLGEECSELGFAALKLARFERNENAVHGRSREELQAMLEEEIADILVCIGEVVKTDLVEDVKIFEFIHKKLERMASRLKVADEGRVQS